MCETHDNFKLQFNIEDGEVDFIATKFEEKIYKLQKKKKAIFIKSKLL